MKFLIKTALVLTLFFKIISAIALQKNDLAKNDIEIILGPNIKISLNDSLMKAPALKSKWTSVKRVDPNSGTEHIYEGYFLKDFLIHIKNEFKLNHIDHIETMALDGYKVTMSSETLEGPGAFIALKVNGVPKKGLYNKILKTYFHWGPSYILLDPKNPKVSVASPYQVKRISIFEKKEENPVLMSVAAPYKRGAEVFIKTCSKCHQHLGFGGKKAPAMKLVIRRWKRKPDDALKAFLRDPQGTLKRKIQMSGYTGPEKDLEELVKFLRSF